MKLKEKLAEEFSKPYEDGDGLHRLMGTAYLKGFEKAKELILEAISDSDPTGYIYEKVIEISEEEI